MAYDITTIGDLVAACARPSCSCGGAKPGLDVQRIAGLVDLANKVNPFSNDFLPYDYARRAADAIQQKAEQAAQKAAEVAHELDPRQAIAKAFDPLPATLDLVGVPPAWAYHGRAIAMGAGIVGVAGAGVLAYKYLQGRKRKKGSRAA